MEARGLDTLKATRALEAAGFDAVQAEALVTVLGGPLSGNVATRQDIRDLRVELRDLRSETKADIDGLRTELKGDIDGLRTELKGDIDGLRTELKGDIDGLRTELVTKAQMYGLLLVQATVIVGLIVGLQQLF